MSAERLAAALPEHIDQACGENAEAHHSCLVYAEAILAADPQLAEAAEFGLAWQRAEAALPEGWYFDGLWLTRLPEGDRWEAAAKEPDEDFRSGYGPTPAAALIALAEELT